MGRVVKVWSRTVFKEAARWLISSGRFCDWRRYETVRMCTAENHEDGDRCIFKYSHQIILCEDAMSDYRLPADAFVDVDFDQIRFEIYVRPVTVYARM